MARNTIPDLALTLRALKAGCTHRLQAGITVYTDDGAERHLPAGTPIKGRKASRKKVGPGLYAYVLKLEDGEVRVDDRDRRYVPTETILSVTKLDTYWPRTEGEGVVTYSVSVRAAVQTDSHVLGTIASPVFDIGDGYGDPTFAPISTWRPTARGPWTADPYKGRKLKEQFPNRTAAAVALVAQAQARLLGLG